MKKALIIVLCLVLCLAAFAGCSGGKNTATPDVATPDSTISEDIATFTVETAYADLAYPKKWQNDVKVDIDDNDGYIVSFSDGGVKLFDLQFDCGDGDVLGTLTRDGKNIILRVKFAALDKSDADYQKHVEMQNAVDVIISYLSKDYQFAEGEENYVNYDDVYEIKTGVVSLYYPKQWEDKVTADVKKDGVYFSCNGVKLFDILFGKADGAYLLGAYDGTDISILSYDLEQGKLSDAEYTALRAMQESVDVIISHLEKEELFVPNKA